MLYVLKNHLPTHDRHPSMRKIAKLLSRNESHCTPLTVGPTWNDRPNTNIRNLPAGCAVVEVEGAFLIGAISSVSYIGFSRLLELVHIDDMVSAN